MNTFTSIFILLSAGLIALGCRKDNGPTSGGTQTPSTVLMPLKTGNIWIYHLTEYDTTGVVQSTNTVGWTVTKDTVIQTEKWYFFLPIGLTINRSDGLWFWTPNSNSMKDPYLFAKYPANVGDVWFSGIGLGLDSTFGKLVAKDTNIVVPLGSYTCYYYIYSERNYGLIQARYFCLGIGLVRDENYSKTQSGRYYIKQRRELKSLTLGK